MKMLNTDRHNDLKKFAQALMLVKLGKIVNLNEIILLEFGGNHVVVDYLLFQIGKFDYCYRNHKLTVREHVVEAW